MRGYTLIPTYDTKKNQSQEELQQKMAALLTVTQSNASEDSPAQEIIYLKCKYCEGIYKSFDHSKQQHPPPPDEMPHDQYPNGCPNPLPRACYNCFIPFIPTLFSNSQLIKMDEGLPARCKVCIQCFLTTKRYPSPPPDPQNIDEMLTDAVQSADVERVRELLAQGANPNYVRRRYVRDCHFRYRLAYHADGTSMPEVDVECFQPTTPLKLVGFRISDCMLKEVDLWRFKEVADLLIANGADAKPALAIMENRYGTWEESGEENEDEEEEANGISVAFCAVFATVFRAATATTNGEL